MRIIRSNKLIKTLKYCNMILDQRLNTSEISLSIKEAPIAMTISADASKIFFSMYIKNTYSNIFGSIVREICSNSADSHAVSDVNQPIIIRKGFDEHTTMPYISFIDFGVGMSPETVNEIYCVFMSSTKRDTNNQIGCFGMGSKSPLAYRRQLAYGSTESDNSFFVITVSEGIRYSYMIYEGKESPMLSLLHAEKTDEHNGTEVRVPMLPSDESKFNNELLKQLYYFDNIIFENINDSRITNDFQIIRANNFLYRGDQYSSNMHICLGKVAYPINYDVLGLDKHDYRYPVALKFNIGDINVVTSREAIDYSDSTIKLIKKKLADAKDELIEMLTKQNDNIITLEDYVNFEKNRFKLVLIKDKTITFNEDDVKNIKLNNFIYSHIKEIPKSSLLFNILYGSSEYSVQRYKKTDYNGAYYNIINNNNVYITDNLSRQKNIKINYLKSIHNNFHLIYRKTISFELIKQFFGHSLPELVIQKDGVITAYTPIYDDILDILNDYNTIIEKHIPKYSDVIVPESFHQTIRNKRGPLQGNIVINIISSNWQSERESIQLKELADFKGSIIYGSPDDLNELKNAANAFGELFHPNSECVKRKDYNGFSSRNYKPTAHKKVLFISVAKGNIKKLQSLKDICHVSNIYNRFFYRKENTVLEGKYYSELEDKLQYFNGLYLDPVLSQIYPTIASNINEIQDILKSKRASINLDDRRYSFEDYFDYSKFTKTKEQFKLEKYIEHIENISKRNEKILACFKLKDLNNKILIKLLKNNLVSETK